MKEFNPKDELEGILNKLDVSDLQMLIQRISVSEELRCLDGKTQVKNSGVENEEQIREGEFNNRYEHSVQVSNIAAKIVEESGGSDKEQLIAQIVGLCHDLGHTPFGHDAEVFFEKKNGEKFEHAKYGAKVFSILFERIINMKTEDGKSIFDDDKKQALTELKKFIESGIYYHQSGYYTASDIDPQIKEIREKESKGEELSEEEIKMLIAFEVPCVQAAMLSDTVAIMQSDTKDLSKAEKPDEEEKVMTTKDKLKIARAIGFEEEDINNLIDMLVKGEEGQEKLKSITDPDKRLEEVLKLLDVRTPQELQEIIATSIGRENVNSKGRFESISDEYKLVADGNQKGYIKMLEEKRKAAKTEEEKYAITLEINEAKENWDTYRKERLEEQREGLKKKNPLLCLTYEIQNELVYNQVIYSNRIKLLENDVDRNFAMFSRIYDLAVKVCKAQPKDLSEEEMEIKKALVAIYKDGNYPKLFDEKLEGSQRFNMDSVVKNLVTTYIQQKGNLGLKELYDTVIKPQEDKVLDSVKSMQEQEMSDEEIVNELGIDKEQYDKFSDIDKAKRIAIMILRGEKKEDICEKLGIDEKEYDELSDVKTKGLNPWEEKQVIRIASDYIKKKEKEAKLAGKALTTVELSDAEIIEILRLEERDLKEIESGKTTIERYVEYEMPLEEMLTAAQRVEERNNSKVQEEMPEEQTPEEETHEDAVPEEQAPEEETREEETREEETRTEGELETLLRQSDEEITPEERTEGTEATVDLKEEEHLREDYAREEQEEHENEENSI